MSDQKRPFVDRALVEALDRKFPNRCPELSDADRDIWFNAGAASVVSYLKSLLKAQESNILNSTTTGVP